MADSNRWLTPLGFAALLAFGACSNSDAEPPPTGVGGASGAHAAAGAGGGGGGGSTSGAAGVAGSPSGRGGDGGTSSGAAGGGDTGGRGGSSAAGAGGTATGRGGSSEAGAGGTAAAGRGGSAGSSRGGTGGTTTTGGGGGGGSTTACTRELLKSAINAFFTALAAKDPSMLPVASNVKVTENGKVMTLGSMGLWTAPAMVKYTQSALDTEQCMSATHAVVPENRADIPVALRLKLVNQQITEIETIAVRKGDYSLASNTGAIIAANTLIKWEESLPADQRPTRAAMTAWMDKYFRSFPNGVCDTTSDCIRLENGAGSFKCNQSAGCVAPSGNPTATPRLIIVDTETGVGSGLTILLSSTDMHMFKMYGGQVHAVHAILGAATSSGW